MSDVEAVANRCVEMLDEAVQNELVEMPVDDREELEGRVYARVVELLTPPQTGAKTRSI